jgi:hypothetical protein
MMRQRRSPGVQDQRRPDVCTQMSAIGGDGAQRFGSDLKQQSIDQRLVVIPDCADRCWQGEDYVVIVNRQQFGLPRFEPALRSTALTLRAMPVAAGVVGDLGMLTRFTAQHMSTERRAAALLDRGHDLALTQAQVRALRLPPGWPMGTEDIRDLQGGTPHGGGLRGVQGLQRTDHLAQNLGGHLGIQRRGVELLVPEQDLDHADVHLLLQKVRGETVSQRVH